MRASQQRHLLHVVFFGLLTLVLAACTEPESSLAAPTEVTATAHLGFNRVTWQHPGSGVTGFAVYRAISGEAEPNFEELDSVGPDARSFDDRTAAAGSAYVYAVAAIGSQGASPRSQASSAVTTLTPDSVTTEDLEVETDEDTPVAVTLGGAYSGDGEISFTVTSAPANGTLSGEAPLLTYSPAPDWFGTDSFEFEVADEHGVSARGTVTITVHPVYDAPVIEAFAADRENVKFGEPVTFTWKVRHVDPEAVTCRIDTGAAVHELGDCSGEGSQFHLYPNVNDTFQAQLIVDDGTTPLESDALAVTVTRRVTPLVGDSDFSVGIRDDGTVVVWGRDRAKLQDVPSDLESVIAVASRTNHILALDSDGTVTFWGMGDGSRGTLDLPPLVGMAAAQHHALGVTADGRVVAWGDGAGTDVKFGENEVPAGLGFAVAVAASHTQSLALLADGTVVGWGQDNWGQVTAPDDLNDVVGIATGSLFSVALKADGTVVAWGAPDGRINVPAGLSDVTAISSGAFHTIALKADGTAVGWGMSGSNNKGQFDVPAEVGELVAVAGARSHSLGLTADGKVVGWGDDTDGKASPPASDATFMRP